MKKNKKIILAVIVLILLIGIGNSAFVVHPNETVSILQFSKIIDIKNTTGLYFKVPFVQSTQRVSTKTVLYDIPASDVITKDKKSMTADNYVLWKVTDSKKYIQTLGAISERANERVEAAVYNATKNVISSMTQDEVIAARGETLTSKITEQANTDIGGYGIVILQSQIKVLDLPDDNKSAVYERMISERQNIAASYTAEGNAAAQKIKNETDKTVTITVADAKKQAAILEADGEAEYMRILANAYADESKADFYSFIRGLDALKESLKGSNKTLILDKNSELVQILYGK